MSIAAYLREIGRGKHGARALDAARAQDLMDQVLDLRISEAERGAFAIAMRIKGESTEELAGFMASAQARCMAVDGSVAPIVLPSYNGSRKLPNLTALLACLLARTGLPVLVHGPRSDPGRVTTHEILQALGLPTALDAAAVHAAWSRSTPAFVPTDVLCPPLAPLLALRAVLGLRNSGHTMAKLLAPRGTPALRVVNYTHPEYATAHTQFLQHSAAHALLMRGCEGEPVADARRCPRLDVFIAGTPRPDLGRAATEGVLAQLPLLPEGRDAASTAAFITRVLHGEIAAPAPLLAQLEVLVRAHRELQHHEAARHERSA